MSKQSKAKEAQNYRETSDMCGNCKHYRSELVEKSYEAYDGMQTWTEEKSKRCGLGGFSVKKTATCDMHEREHKK